MSIQLSEAGISHRESKQQANNGLFMAECIRETRQVHLSWTSVMDCDNFRKIVGKSMKGDVEWSRTGEGGRKYMGRINDYHVYLDPSFPGGLPPKAGFQVNMSGCSRDFLKIVRKIASKTSNGIEIPTVEAILENIENQMAPRK